MLRQEETPHTGGVTGEFLRGLLVRLARHHQRLKMVEHLVNRLNKICAVFRIQFTVEKDGMPIEMERSAHALVTLPAYDADRSPSARHDYASAFAV